MNRLLLALAAFVGLGILSWTTISDSRIRLVTLLILGLFAFKTVIRRNDVIHRGEEEKDVETQAR